ncbi:MAG TPA: HEPN domain-containing protein [Bradyrhizobium sp.]
METFRQLAELRLTEAKLLYANGLASGAYYLAGYAVECALKAVIAAGFRANEIPDKSRVNNIYTHNLKDLLNLAGLKSPLENDMNEVSELRESWATISKWSEHARYEIWTSDAATTMLEAVGADKGLLQWLLKR